MPRNRLVTLHRLDDGDEVVLNFDLVQHFERATDVGGTPTGTVISFGNVQIQVSETLEQVFDLAEKA